MEVGKSVRVFLDKHGFALYLLIPGVIYSVFFLIIIIFSLLQLSFTDQMSAMEKFPSLVNYSSIFASKEFWQSLWRTVIFVSIGTPLQLFAGLCLAILVHKNFAGRGIVRSIFLLPIAIPAMVTAVIVSYMLFCFPFGHVNDLLLGKLFLPQLVSEPVNWQKSPELSLALPIIAKVWRDMPISMLILLAGLQSISSDQYEAARTMGADALQRFFYLTIPLLIPAISTVLILRSIEMWKEFIFPFIIAPSYPILGVLIEYAYNQEKNVAKAAALSLILAFLIGAFASMITFTLKKMQNYLVKV